jgi:hypothetical protein
MFKKFHQIKCILILRTKVRKLNDFVCGKADVKSLYTDIKVSNVDAYTPLHKVTIYV